MSSPFSSWGKRRTLSLTSQTHPQDSEERSPSPASGQAATTPLSPPRSTVAQGSSDAKLLSSSFNSPSQRAPIRSFIHGSQRDVLAPVNSAQSAQSVREDTAELASYFLSDKKKAPSPAFFARNRSHSFTNLVREASASDAEQDDVEVPGSRASETILEVSEPPSPEERDEELEVPAEGPSIIASMLRRSPVESRYTPEDDLVQDGAIEFDTDDEEELDKTLAHPPRPLSAHRDHVEDQTEYTPLLPTMSRESRRSYGTKSNGRDDVDPESLKVLDRRRWFTHLSSRADQARGNVSGLVKVVRDPQAWDRQALWQSLVVAPITCLPAVIVGLLLNILDALSYGMILFPLGSPIFANLGSAGISIFYVSTIVSQLTFSCGSIFKGGVGSELIEVVPFFHNMAATITDMVGADNPDAVIATTITSYALSSMMTGAVFWLMGKFKFGYIVGFIPRHILIGCIGGVGFFLVATGFEVTARMDGSLEYNLDTLKRLASADTIPLWLIPFVLAVLLFYGQTKLTSKFFLPMFILTIPLVFYFFVFSLDALNTDALRDHGWIFEGPPSGEPWWYFYTLYKFDQVHWGAVLQCVPAMMALTFFGILHVPINVPALALNTGEDHADLDHELKLHGYSNFLSGLAGSIQNYLVYANTVFFMRSGGNSRLAGVLLALLTFGVMVIGPSIVGFIPVMMVGVLIFDLGFELLLESVWQPRKKLKPLEYVTVIIIVLIMGIYDFVVGIGVGIILAFASLIFQTSRVSAVRATYSGDVVGSTVRRNPSQHHYLQQVGRQIYITKLAGYLFFGTIVSVEEKIRGLISDDAFKQRPIRFLILDMWQVTGLDYSAGQAFTTITRLLHNKGIDLVLSGVDAECAVGRNLRAMGLGENGTEVAILPDLNSALEYCENELLKTFYEKQEAVRAARTPATASLAVPGQTLAPASSHPSVELLASSPRRLHLHEAAQRSIVRMEDKLLQRWQSFKEPLRLMLQIFQDLSDKNEDFWFRAVPFFERQEFPSGAVLFRRDETAEGFYLVEQGILRAEYDLPQGWLCESIVAGTTCGELPFFSETSRTATAVVERDCVVWLMDKANWEQLQKQEPDVAQELLRISLKLTSERMSVITSYILTMAG
ncbi:hypothetical protein GQ53DRAFT_785789 [Thozetella sp. PMI_491]|nr:hypothetical protein GQ53DRAFT_785789 [Thozetella sp. PMI_491]